MPLLNFEKPKILVYGIYDAGKSTLVNSSGIDAPIEHEKIADKEINSCHMIMFVMSSRGNVAAYDGHQQHEAQSYRELDSG